MTTIIGLLGGAGSGKSTCADFLVEHYGAKKYAFADPLKLLVMRTFDFSLAQVYGSQAEKETVDERWGISPRQAMQRIGQGMREEFGEDVWVDHLLRRVRAEGVAIAVIEDVRYCNEARNLRAWGRDSHVWRLENPERISAADPTHQSEAEWQRAEYDLVIAPSARSLAALYSLIRDAARQSNLMREQP